MSQLMREQQLILWLQHVAATCPCILTPRVREALYGEAWPRSRGPNPYRFIYNLTSTYNPIHIQSNLGTLKSGRLIEVAA